MESLNSRAAEALARIRSERPLIHHITNLVVMNDTANLTLHVGALPVMAHAPEEVIEMASMAGALVLNIGTLTRETIAAMLTAGQQARTSGIPIVLDPVGAGATRLRTEASHQLLQALPIAVLRGNAGEIGALSGAGGVVKGVESIAVTGDPVVVARQMARSHETVVAITARRDVISDGARTLGVENGHQWLTSLTGTGCMATTMIAAFAAVERDYLLAAASGLAVFGLAAELAAERTAGPASFKVALFDQLYHLTPQQVLQHARIVSLSDGV